MNLGEFVKQYREKNNLSQRKFALRCGLSNGYISMLEDGKNPSTGKPLVPKIENVMKIASAMGYDLGTLFDIIDDMEIDISAFIPKTSKKAYAEPDALTDKERQLLELFRLLTDEEQEHVLRTAKMIAKQ
jgi:transcriptional regulator with XRE-family HTH domain